MAHSIFGHQGPSLRSSPNTNLAVLGITRGHIGMKLDRIGLGLTWSYPMAYLEFWPPGGRVYLVTRTLNWPFWAL